MKVALIKYNAGNIQSVSFALERLGIDFMITDDKEEIGSADKVIFPGVGEASSTMEYLRNKKLDSLIRDLKPPVPTSPDEIVPHKNCRDVWPR